MAMVPHERSLVERFQHRPFVLLGVNADSSPRDLKRIQENKNISWRSWWDGGQGHIAATFKIRGWPTLLLIDHEGMIRQTCEGRPRDSDLEKALNQLIQEAEEDLKQRTAEGGRTSSTCDS
jgi:hypothetical protein